MRRWFGIILAVLLLATIAPAYAIPAEFTAWLYTPDTGEMTLVDLSGERETFDLPLAPPYEIRPFTNVAVSPARSSIRARTSPPSTISSGQRVERLSASSGERNSAPCGVRATSWRARA